MCGSARGRVYPLQMAQAMIGGITLRGATRAHDEYLIALQRGEKEPFTAELFARAVREGDTVIDGGSYLGFYALLAARRVGPEGTVLAFEPNPELFEAMRRNVRENGFDDRVIPLPVGIGAGRGRSPFYIGEGDGSKSSLFEPKRLRDVTVAESMSLDEGLGARPVDLVKLDIEGGEIDALRGMRETLTESPDPTLIVECNPTALARAGKSPRTLLRELDTAGLEVDAIDDERWELRPVSEALSETDGHVNLLCRYP